MRKAFLLGAVAASALMASNAWADVDVVGTVDKDITITVTENVAKIKVVGIVVVITSTPAKAGESSTHFNQENNGNRACENCAEKQDLISASVLLNTGITSVNQSSGNNNNQATVISFAVDQFQGPPPPPDQPPAPSTGGFAESQVAGAQNVTRNLVQTVNITFRDSIITGSINGNTGITAVNQAAGNINNQANGISIAISLASGVSLSDSALGQLVSGNVSDENNVSKTAQTLGSINRNQGITQVNQSTGNLGNQSNVVSLAVARPF